MTAVHRLKDDDRIEAIFKKHLLHQYKSPLFKDYIKEDPAVINRWYLYASVVQEKGRVDKQEIEDEIIFKFPTPMEGEQRVQFPTDEAYQTAIREIIQKDLSDKDLMKALEEISTLK
jgi:hypothetical protein